METTTGETVTCLHGFSQRGRSWRELAVLVGGPHRWLAPDVEAATLEAATADLLDLWDATGARRSHLVGYSAGGRLALHLATRHPERLRTLTVISAHAGFEGPARAARQAADEALAARIEVEGIDWFADHWGQLPMFASLRRRRPELRGPLDADRRSHDPRRLAAALRGMGGAAAEPFWDRLPSVGVPALVVAGAEDTPYVEHAGRLARLLACARAVIVPGAGHAVHLENPPAVASLLAAHLSSR
jgi:2-succinyl-6-hydroxy-2,4-cyclohexadiene-1-carboxylate synthase